MSQQTLIALGTAAGSYVSKMRTDTRLAELQDRLTEERSERAARRN